ncbi:uncharacterized protein [Ambystoma mexicanum]|uniref:uncharacterized protein n=1 Tax=Ambystoma mexicanum TaxID=8296 RepID=UPI0037E8F145
MFHSQDGPDMDIIADTQLDGGTVEVETALSPAQGQTMNAEAWATFSVLAKSVGWEAAMIKMGAPQPSGDAITTQASISPSPHNSSDSQSSSGLGESITSRKRQAKMSGCPRGRKTKKELEEDLAELTALVAEGRDRGASTSPAGDRLNRAGLPAPICEAQEDAGPSRRFGPPPRGRTFEGELDWGAKMDIIMDVLRGGNALAQGKETTREVGVTGPSKVWAAGEKTTARNVGDGAAQSKGNRLGGSARGEQPGENTASPGKAAEGLPAITENNYLCWHIPDCVQKEIAKGRFIDTFSLLEHETKGYATLQASGSREVVKARKRVRPEENLQNWVAGFRILAQIIVQSKPEQGPALYNYSQCVIEEHRKWGGTAWLLRDQRFRKRMEIDPKLKWEHKLVEDWLDPRPVSADSLITKGPSISGQVLDVPRSVQQALPATTRTERKEFTQMEHPQGNGGGKGMQNPQPGSFRVGRGGAGTQGLGRPPHPCRNFNEGHCNWLPNCRFRHECSICGSMAHAAKFCRSPGTGPNTWPHKEGGAPNM